MHRFPVYFSRFYSWLIRILCRWRVAVCILLLLAFGLPVFLLPEKMKGEDKWAEFYNKTLGTSTYKEKVKPVVDKALGGALRLFVQKVYEGSYFTRNEEVVLHANANLPNGSTLEQMNTLIKRMETYLMNESVLNVKIFDEDVRFKEQGGFKKIDKVFQNQLENIVLELNTYLYDDGGKTA